MYNFSARVRLSIFLSICFVAYNNKLFLTMTLRPNWLADGKLSMIIKATYIGLFFLFYDE